MLRAALLVGLIVLPVSSACAGGSSRTPRWPKSHVAETDGGESLAPRQASSIAAIEKSAVVEIVEDKPAARAEKPAEATTAAAPTVVVVPLTNDVITTEDIVIEIDDE
ncbi:MAG: hypothetical protein H6Q90_6377 [Deltaproteobacteria bacterium]|nr:hypothetical protein [Deltaproteobacteria bacterium]